MAAPEPQGLQGELAAFRQRHPHPAVGSGRLWPMALALGLTGGALAYVLAAWDANGENGLRTSEVEAFQDDRSSDRGRLEFPALPEPDPVETVRLLPGAPGDDGLAQELQRLRQELASLQSGREADLAALKTTPPDGTDENLTPEEKKELDRMMSFTERMMRRFFEMVGSLKKEMTGSGS